MGEGSEPPAPKGGKLVTRRPQLASPQQPPEGQSGASINILGVTGRPGCSRSHFPSLGSRASSLPPPGSCFAY